MIFRYGFCACLQTVFSTYCILLCVHNKTNDKIINLFHSFQTFPRNRRKNGALLPTELVALLLLLPLS